MLFEATSPEKGYRQKNIDKAFNKFHANTIRSTDGEQTQFVEDWLAKEIDDPLGRALAAIERDPCAIISNDIKRVVAKYLASQVFRSPRARQAMGELAGPQIELAESLHSLASIANPNISANYFDGVVPENFREAFLQSLTVQLDDSHVEMIMDCDFAFATPKDTELFCISDFPHMRYDDPRIALDGLASENWVILGPRLAVCFIKGSQFSLGGVGISLPNSYVRRLNYDFAMRSQLVASKCVWQLHRTVRKLGKYTSGRNLSETRPERG